MRDGSRGRMPNLDATRLPTIRQPYGRRQNNSAAIAMVVRTSIFALEELMKKGEGLLHSIRAQWVLWYKNCHYQHIIPRATIWQPQW